jgi:hypothetical protein
MSLPRYSRVIQEGAPRVSVWHKCGTCWIFLLLLPCFNTLVCAGMFRRESPIADDTFSPVPFLIDSRGARVKEIFLTRDAIEAPLSQHLLQVVYGMQIFMRTTESAIADMQLNDLRVVISIRV